MYSPCPFSARWIFLTATIPSIHELKGITVRATNDNKIRKFVALNAGWLNVERLQ
jgi:hypothetical protein